MKILKHPQDRVGDFQSRVLVHTLIGFLIGVSWMVHWSFPLVLTYLLVRYEENEDLHTKDQAWKDYAGAIAGMVIGGIASAAVNTFSRS